MKHVIHYDELTDVELDEIVQEFAFESWQELYPW